MGQCQHLATDARFSPPIHLFSPRVSLPSILDGIFRSRTTRDWTEALEAAGVPSGPINTLEQVFREPQAVARGLKIEIAHPLAGKVALTRSPMRFSETPVEHNVPPPLLGQHTDEILRGLLGRSEADIAQLRADGAV